MRILAFLLLPFTLLGQPSAAKRVAVFEFDNAGVQGGVSSPFFQTSTPNLGKAVADLLVNRLVKNASVVVIERSALDKVLSEQNLSNSDRTNALTAAKIGRILGVDAIILGTITKYDFEDKTTGGRGASFGGIGGSSMSTKHDYKALVEISARLIGIKIRTFSCENVSIGAASDTLKRAGSRLILTPMSARLVSPDTAEVLAVAQGSAEVIKKGVKVDMRDMGRLMGMGGGANSGPIANEAVDKAVTQLAGQLDQSLPKITPRTP